MTPRLLEARGPTAEELHRRALDGWAAMTNSERDRWLARGVTGLPVLREAPGGRLRAERAWTVPEELAR